MPTWPATLPQYFEVDGASLDPISNATTIDTESGEPLTRQRFTGDMDRFTGKLLRMTRAQAAILRTFYRVDLAHGALRFTWEDVLTGASIEYLMIAPPQIVPVSGDVWQATLHLQSMPT